MSWFRWQFASGVALAIVLVGSSWWATSAQPPAAGMPRVRESKSATTRATPPAGVTKHEGPRATASVQEALLRPLALPFARETTLEEVAQFLRKALHAPVILDLAALNRQELTPQDTVQLALEGVRLKTGLKLLLDQLGLTYRVVPEDNLLVLTDPEGSEDPLELILAELRTLHREVHDLQDAVDELRGYEEGGDEGGRSMRVTAARRAVRAGRGGPRPVHRPR